MALPKKKSRSITIDDKRYRWVTNGNDYGIDLYIEFYDSPGQKVHAIFDYNHSQIKLSDNTVIMKQQKMVTPFIVQNVIKIALAKGWKPEERGKDLVFMRLDL